MPPGPLPAGFDWTPLAQDFCAQLAACGYPTQGCVQAYLDEINNPSTGAAAPGGPPTEQEDTTETAACEDSVEAQANPAICNVKKEYRRGREPRQ